MLNGRTVGGSSRPLNQEEAKKALTLFADPGSGCGLRALPSGRSFVCASRDIEKLIEFAVERMDDGEQVYLCFNPVPPNLGRPVKQADVLCRRWLFIDVDPVKPTEHKDQSATQQEKDNANEVLSLIRDYLTGRGWPAPVIADSGNGCYLIYRVDLPADPLSKAAIRDLLYFLKEKFDGDKGKIDTSVHNADRLGKLPGGWAMKGHETTDRPWRQAKLLHVPDALEAVSFELIRDVRINEPKEEAKPESNGLLKGRATASTQDRSAYAKKALDNEIGRVALAPAGERNNSLNKAAYNLGQLVAGGELAADEVEVSLAEAAKSCGLDADPNCGMAGIGKTIRSGLDAGKTKPRKAPEEKEPPSASASVPAGESIIILASAVTPRKVEWLWPGRIPLGKLTTFAGVGGLGKTFVLCDITARVSLGMDWPDSKGECCERGRVLFVSGEDDPDDTLVPRLIELGADLSRVAFLKSDVQDKFTLKDLKTLDRALNEFGDDVRFIAIDPPACFLGDADDHKNAELRSLLSPLKTWAAKRRVAITFNTHLNKPQGKVEAMMRVMGSVAWVNAVRAAHMFARDPDDPERRFFVGMKLNIGKERKGLAYKIVSVGDLAKVEWLGEIDTTADEAVNRESSGGNRKRSAVASDWLAEIFAETDTLPSKEVWNRKKKETSISDNGLKEAKDEMGITARQDVGPDGERQWFWHWSGEAKHRWQVKQKLKSMSALGRAVADTEKAMNDEDTESF